MLIRMRRRGISGLEGRMSESTYAYGAGNIMKREELTHLCAVVVKPRCWVCSLSSASRYAHAGMQ